jgi:hypothetical protein
MSHFFQYRYVSVKTRHSTVNHLKSSQISSKFCLLVESCRDLGTVFAKKKCTTEKRAACRKVILGPLSHIFFFLCMAGKLILGLNEYFCQRATINKSDIQKN